VCQACEVLPEFIQRRLPLVVFVSGALGLLTIEPTTASLYSSGGPDQKEAGAGQRGEYRSRRHQGSDAGDGDRADTDQPTEHPSERGTRSCASSDTFRSLRIDLVRQISCRLVTLRQNR